MVRENFRKGFFFAKQLCFYGAHESTQTTRLRLENCSIFQHFQDINSPRTDRNKKITITEIRTMEQKNGFFSYVLTMEQEKILFI